MTTVDRFCATLYQDFDLSRSGFPTIGLYFRQKDEDTFKVSIECVDTGAGFACGRLWQAGEAPDLTGEPGCEADDPRWHARWMYAPIGIDDAGEHDTIGDAIDAARYMAIAVQTFSGTLRADD